MSVVRTAGLWPGWAARSPHRSCHLQFISPLVRWELVRQSGSQARGCSAARSLVNVPPNATARLRTRHLHQGAGACLLAWLPIRASAGLTVWALLEMGANGMTLGC